DHIEVLRGPSSALYGSLGFLAIINIVTRAPSEKHWARATFDLFDGSTYRGAVSVSHRFKNQLEFGVHLIAHGGIGNSYTYPDLQNNSGCMPDFPGTCKNGVSDRQVDAS